LLFPAFLYIFAGAPDTFLAILVAGAGLFAIAILEPYRMERFTAFLHYEEHADGIGYQTMQSLIAVGSGGIMGQGAGNGLAKFYYLPEQHTDFAFAVWCQEWGLIGASIVVLLLLALIAFGMIIASRLRDVRLALIVYGCSLLIGVQGLLNVAMVIGCFPVTGVPLPFISYGGTALLTNLIAVGLIAGAVAEDERRERKRAESEWSPDTKLSDVAGGAFRVPERR
jgi:cell division protein FtsW